MSSSKRKRSEGEKVVMEGVQEDKQEQEVKQEKDEKPKLYVSPLMTQWPLWFSLERRGEEDAKADVKVPDKPEKTPPPRAKQVSFP